MTQQHQARRAQVKQVVAVITLWLVGAYGALLAMLLVVRLVVGDRSAVLFAINALSLYGFAPLPFVVLASLALRRPSAFAISAVGLVAWIGFWGELFLPNANTHVATKSLIVLSFNALGLNRNPADTVHVIRDARADLVALQELNPETATLIEQELAGTYPYRWLEPRTGVTGGGILSKHPLTRAPTGALTGSWVGTPMVATIEFSGKKFTFVRFHAVSGPAFFRQREQQAHALAEFARTRRTPLIIAGDLNATDQNRAYSLITEELHDAWRQTGWGFGHTFPGQPTPELGGSRPLILGIPVPLWLIRIDYVFHSDELQASDARLAAYARGSDHRGVIATLSFR